ncbi:hypothetical protein [Candidatus Vampirococcus lugosii]|uniref:Uncharacterized protein n=1 Tax=Candidatus Vampirococcus lugosii TaxID=2789015 RepID=A0ABS5QLE1_9BACT|nr:hypothetical protein [Candidatus Vampirococcus lugosii]MBS8122015.1 hypothetical protein [Candidatus Vampirococcus lugosii]
MKKIIILFIIITSIIKTYGESNFFNFASIKDTDELNFEGEKEGIVYEVKVDKNNPKIIDGKDGGEHHCFPVIGTGYTNKIGEVYFQYGDKGTYTCGDGKYRGMAKLAAGGRIDFEHISDNYYVFSDQNDNRYNNPGDEGLYYHTGQSYSNGLGMWQWELVKTDIQSRKIVYDLIDENKSKLIFIGNAKANFSDKLNYKIILRDNNGKLINSILINDHKLNEKNLVDKNDGTKVNGYKLSEINGKNGKNGKISGIIAGQNNLGINIIYDKDTDKVLTGNINLEIPGNIDLKLSGVGNKYIGENIDAEFETTGISNFVGIGNLNYESSQGISYNIINGDNVNSKYPFKIKLMPFGKKVDENGIYIYYKIDGKYDFGQYLNINSNSLETSKIKLDPDKQIKESIYYLNPNCSNAKAKGDKCNINIKMLNQYGYTVPNFDLGNIKIEDTGNFFDLDETDNTNYTTGFNYDIFDTSTDEEGEIKIRIGSYKPVRSAQLDINYDNISIGTKIKGLNFQNIVSIGFQGINVGDGIMINEENEISLVYTGLINNVNLEDFDIVGDTVGCFDCVFEEGEVFSGFGNSKIDGKIVISGTNLNKVEYYNGHYQYEIDGKKVKLIPNTSIDGNRLNIAGKFFGIDITGILNRGYNIEEILAFGNENQIGGSGISFSNYINKKRKEVIRNLKGKKELNRNEIKEIRNVGNEIYNCNGNEIIIDLISDVEGKNKLVFIDCKMIISSDIKIKNDGFLQIYSFSNDGTIKFNKTNGWNINGNIYIGNEVDTIQTNITTDGSILSIDNMNGTISDIMQYNLNDEKLKQQLYIKGNIISRNTYGGGIINTNEEVVLPGGRRIHQDNFLFNNAFAYKVSQRYDINFLRNSYVDENDNYNINKVSPIVKNRYNCTGDKSDHGNCKKPVVIEGR